LSEQPERPEFVRVAPPPSPGGGGNSGGGYGPYFGSVPDFAEVKDGVRFSDVRPGSPAEKAGLQGGDILTEFDGKKISNLYDYTYALRGRKPGDTVQVKIRRGDASLEFSVLLEARK
jgi:S1-C subfamily serine protease